MQMDIDLLIPCLVDQFFPDSAMNMVKVLRKAGCRIHYNPDQTCCGFPAYDSGHWEYAQSIGNKVLTEFETDRLVVGMSGTCVGHLRHSLVRLFEERNLVNKSLALKERAFEFSEFLVEVCQRTDFGAKFEGTATFLDACNAVNKCGIKEAPRQLLANVEGLSLRELPSSDICCGYNGGFFMENPGHADRFGLEKVNQIIASTGAEYIISTDMSCLMHLDRVIKANDKSLKVLHLADVLASGW